MAADLEAVKALLSFSQVGPLGKVPGKFYPGRRVEVPEAPLTPQTSDAESDEERERDVGGTAVPMDLVMARTPEPEKKNGFAGEDGQLTPAPVITQQPVRASVIMKAHSDGTFGPAKFLGESKNLGSSDGRQHQMIPPRDFPPPEEPPSRKTDGSEMTSGHRDKVRSATALKKALKEAKHI